MYRNTKCTEKVISAPKLITFLPPAGTEKSFFHIKSNSVPYPKYLYLSVLAFFTNLTVRNKELPSVESLPSA